MKAKWDYHAWVRAWGWNAPLIVGGTNDEFPVLPKVPDDFGWLVTRELTDGKPAFGVVLWRGFNGHDNTNRRLVSRGEADGPSGVIELAQQMKERHCEG